MFVFVLGAMAQGQYFYEWKDGKFIQRSLCKIDSITFSLPETPHQKEYKYVDLGLPSGTLWADRNVGADSPEAYGDYFAWGETEPKEVYDFSTYKWCRGSYNTMTKYCTKSSYGIDDNNIVLDLEDDAAYVNMGTEWRMPTDDELRELLNECTWTWSTQNGVACRKATGPNGKSIFLPLTDGYYGYWSSSLDEGSPHNAWYLDSNATNHTVSYYHRCYGRTVRAVVRKEPIPEVNMVDLGLPSGTLWADRNVGADSPEDYGDYFAWGETTTKGTYNWSTYKWCKGYYSTMTKYCTDSDYGNVDNKTVLDLEDDVAYVNMGTEWRMPTYDELYELVNVCTWTYQDGFDGYKVVGPNGKSILLPSGGCRGGRSLDYFGTIGYYWSSSLYENEPHYAWSLRDNAVTKNYCRYQGYLVRAVAR